MTFDRKCHEKKYQQPEEEVSVICLFGSFLLPVDVPARSAAQCSTYGGESDLMTGNYICDPLNNF